MSAKQRLSFPLLVSIINIWITFIFQQVPLICQYLPLKLFNNFLRAHISTLGNRNTCKHTKNYMYQDSYYSIRCNRKLEMTQICINKELIK